MRSVLVRFTVAVFAVHMAVRWALIAAYPENYSMDAYQRWGGRDHVLVQDWLPVTQGLVWAVAKLGGGIDAMRLAMAVVGALAATAGAWVARVVGGPAAGWLFVPVGLFGPFLTWSVVPYQEGAFLAALFGGMAVALTAHSEGRPPTHRAWRIADLLIGLLALVRYEGWPVVIVYIAWRRDARAFIALWGAAVWLMCKANGLEGHAASPISYADWEGIQARFTLTGLNHTLRRLLMQSIDTAGVLLIPAGVAAWEALRRQRRPAAWLFGLVFAGQLAALAGWIVGLETATYRMQAVPGVLAGLFLATAAGLWWHRTRSRGGRLAVTVVAVAASAAFIEQGFDNAKRSTRSVRWEQRLVTSMNDCPTCTYLVTPRTGLGTRDRHDGCEIIQGLSTHLHGEAFWCMAWGAPPDAFVATHAARWRKGGYVIRDARKSDRASKDKR